ncbi:MAG: hypothetical protein J6C37_10645 [Roseburia sp.]|nr:hypothetical protein [Roseburia sp.]
MKGNVLPMNLQFFAESGNGQGVSGGGTEVTPAGQVQTPEFDYEKLASIISGKQSAAEDTVLKGYFKQQGLSEEEMKQAISAFKQQKAASQPDVGVLQTQLTQAQALAQQAQIQNAATMMAVSLGIDAKTIPYILRMADLSQVMGQDGKINDETLKNALNKVLEDVPALKPQASGSTGFVQVGAGSGNQQQSTNDDALKKAFGL